MITLEDKANWLPSHIKPDKNGLYMTHHPENGYNVYVYDIEKKVWGNGVNKPKTGHQWLNVRIEL